jgi:hypothetical protein
MVERNETKFQKKAGGADQSTDLILQILLNQFGGAHRTELQYVFVLEIFVSKLADKLNL